jgi:hypothetical protein
MAFIDSTSAQRVELLRQAEKTANLTRRVTVGSGVLGAPEGVTGASLCTSLSTALAAIGYSAVPADKIVVSNHELVTIITGNGDPQIQAPALIEDDALSGIELPADSAVVSDGDVVTGVVVTGTFTNTVKILVSANSIKAIQLS